MMWPALFLALSAQAAETAGLQGEYTLLVCAESADEVHEVRFDGAQASVTRVHRLGAWPTEIEGPHGLGVDPSGDSWYVTLAHGNPYGSLHKFDADSGQVLGSCELGLFPATLCVSQVTGLLYCVNFDLHGDMSPSDVSVVDPEAMVEVGRTQVGAMPHGSRLGPGGLKVYVCSMMDGTLVELDAESFDVRRRLSLEPRPSAEMLAVQLAARKAAQAAGRPLPVSADHDHTRRRLPQRSQGETPDEATPEDEHGITRPTWAAPDPLRGRVYVCLNGTDEVVEVDTKSWVVTRRFPTGAKPYNAEVSADGKSLVVTYKGGQATGIWDLVSGLERARVPNSAPIPHGVVLSPDSRFAFVSCENRGASPGRLDVIDVNKGLLVTSVAVGLQAGGIALLP